MHLNEKQKIAFVDRDGTIIIEPTDTRQINSLQEMNFVPGAILGLHKLYISGYKIVVVSNQDGLGSASNSLDNYCNINDKILTILSSVGIHISQICTCPHYACDYCDCRKPKTGLVHGMTFDHESSVMIGDRESDMIFASNLGIKGFLLKDAVDCRWHDVVKSILCRRGKYSRYTNEVKVDLEINLDGNGCASVDTGLKFFDHLLCQFVKHGKFDLTLNAVGDLEVDEHHTIEDVAISLGESIAKVLGNKLGIERMSYQVSRGHYSNQIDYTHNIAFTEDDCSVAYNNTREQYVTNNLLSHNIIDNHAYQNTNDIYMCYSIVPLDESISFFVVDLCSRGYLVYDANFEREYVGDIPTEMIKHFFYSLSMSLGAAIHIRIRGENHHHMLESCFKAMGKSLHFATRITSDAIPSTKGLI